MILFIYLLPYFYKFIKIKSCQLIIFICTVLQLVDKPPQSIEFKIIVYKRLWYNWYILFTLLNLYLHK